MDFLKWLGGMETGSEERKREERERRDREDRDERRREREYQVRVEREREERRNREKQEEEERNRRERKEREYRQKYEDQSERRRMNDSRYLKNSEEIETEFFKNLRSLERDVNIIVIGSPGVGKSTLITNMHFATTEQYKKVASCGKYEDGKSFTKYPMRYCLTKSVESKSNVYLIDCPGLQNRAFTKYMDDLFSGSINVREKKRGKEISLKEQMEGKSVDWVIFVHSAREVAPEHLCRSVLMTAREYDLDLYTVLTMTDTVDEEELQAAEKDIGLKLGTHNTTRHISIAHVCNKDDINNKKKAQVVCHKIRQFLNEMMSDDIE